MLFLPTRLSRILLANTLVRAPCMLPSSFSSSSYSSSSSSPLVVPPPVIKSYPYELTVGRTTHLISSPPTRPFLVPKFKSTHIITSSDIKVLEWMLRKEKLGQDMFLIGPPSSYKRRIVQLYGYLMQREMEVVQISRDTTEADLKQRREILGKGVVFCDQAPVRCALNGSMLVLDGVEKAERNVLPLLNNLLENREMNLEDGRQLIPHTRYDALVKQHGAQTVGSWKLERVSEDFRVVALGLPVPAFKGNPLDPPLRSRFQAKDVGGGWSRDEMVMQISRSRSGGGGGSHEPTHNNNGNNKKIVNDGVTRMVDLAYSINLMKQDIQGQVQHQQQQQSCSMPWFVCDSLVDGGKLLESLAHKHPVQQLVPAVFHLMYPFKTPQVKTVLDHNLGDGQALYNSIVQQQNQREHSTLVPNHPLPSQSATLQLLDAFLRLPDKQRAPLLYGPQGSGKSTLASYAAQLLGKRPMTTIQVYKDMSVRELLQSRTTNEAGDTVWTLSPLVHAAINGHVCVLDGMENLHGSVVGLLGRLVGDRCVVLPDGVTTLGGGDDQRSSLTIHPEFELIGIANSEDLELTPELSTVFFVFDVGMAESEKLVVGGGGEVVKKLLAVGKELSDAGGKSNLSLARALSIGQVKRIGKRVKRKQQQQQTVDLFSEIMNACLVEFLPSFEKSNFVSVLRNHGILPLDDQQQQQLQRRPAIITVNTREDNNKVVRIGKVESPVREETEWAGKIPSGGVFFDIDAHVRVLESMADDFVTSGDHLLLIGNQGVGKNKLVDRMLELIGRGREYVQLHRDTTVHSLTTLQRIENGVIKTHDSPLVQACRHGLVLVIDEADKAPAHVTASLKGLAERGEMVLPDGRIIGKDIPLHPDFRMILLANRPGFPFLGNSFYNVLSHLFSVYAICNPGLQSEVELLRNYGPDVGEVERVAKVFGELRGLSNDGVLTYPYSLREAVHVVRHLDKFPGELRGAFSNVFDFDRWGDGWGKVKNVLEKEFGGNVMVEEEEDQEERGTWVLKIVERKGGEGGGESGRKELGDNVDPKEGKFDPSGAPHVGGNTWAGGSGGTSTAGLGGAGGPYRLSDGNPVFQISPDLKSRVSPELLEKARQLSSQLYEQKLKELQMSKYDASVYNSYVNPISHQIQLLRNILETLQCQAKERKWVRHQTQGDLDDTKLIEGLIGDKNVYKSRQEMSPEVGDPQQKPKLLRLLVDCSASMYRFNGYDHRLDRMLSCVLMVMEAFKGNKLFQFEVYGHSGDGWDYKFCHSDDEVVKDERGRLEVLKRIYLHSQFCMSGDSTLEATHYGLEELGKVVDEHDEVFMVVLSDANFERYGISVEEFKKVLSGGGGKGGEGRQEVRCYFVFIGSLGDQAQRLVGEMGGRGLLCLDAGELPNVMQRVFMEGVLK